MEKQHHLFAAREERGQGGLRGCVAVPFSRTRDPTPEQQPCCPGSHRDIPDGQTLLQPTGDTRAGVAGCVCRSREERGSRLGIQLRFGSLFPRQALPFCSHARTQGHPPWGPHRTQPFPTFPHHWLRQALAPGTSEIPGRCWPHSTKGEKARPAPTLLQRLKLSLTLLISTSKPSSEPLRMKPSIF